MSAFHARPCSLFVLSSLGGWTFHTITLQTLLPNLLDPFQPVAMALPPPESPALALNSCTRGLVCAFRLSKETTSNEVGEVLASFSCQWPRPTPGM